ncbi:MAG: ABC transporter permease subunit [Pygmaiobacter sp.]
MRSLSEFLAANGTLVLWCCIKEVVLVFVTFGFALLLGLPLGLLCYRNERFKRPLLCLIELLQTLPALALFGIFVAVGRQGLGTTLLLALIYTILPVIFGTDQGLHSIDRATIDAALGMGMTRGEVFCNVLLPLASCDIMPALRKAAITAVGMITMATLSGGGLGILIMEGIRTHSVGMILAGALPACLLALVVDLIMSALQKAIVPEALRRAPKEELFISK